jgi:hypothetical protein
MSRLPSSARGTVSLLVLSLVTVLAIALAGYITVSGRSMRLANRVFLHGVASNLAESGVEQALWTLNEQDWTSWTAVGGGALASSDTVAVRTITFASTKYGSSGVVGSINLRIHGRNARPWLHSDTYTTAQVVWYLGRWWQCVTNHGPVSLTTFPSTTANWIPAPSAWNAAVTYSAGTSATNADIVVSGGTAYRCTAANTNSQPPSANWTSLGTPAAWSASAAYSVNAVVTYQGTVYRCRAANTGFVPTNPTYWVGAPAIHAEGVATPPGATAAGSGGAVRVQVRAELAPVPLFPNALGGVSVVSLASTGNVGAYIPAVVAAAATTWTNGASYAVGAIVVDNNGYWRCTSAHTANSTRRPPNASFWSNSLLQDYSAVVGAPSVTMSNSANIWGHVTAPTTSFATGAVVKSATSPASPNQDPSRISSNEFVPAPTIQAVAGATNLPAPHTGTVLNDGSATLGTPGATAPAIYNITATWQGGWTYSGLYLEDSGDVLTIDGPVVLNVSGMLYTNAGTIVVTANGSLEIHFTGQLYIGNNTTSGSGFGSGGGIVNQTLDPTRVILVSNSSYTTGNYHYFWSSRPFHGLIYMPGAYLHNWNSGYNPPRYGAMAARTVYFNHTVNVQYDERLRTAGRLARFVDAPFYVSAWRELTDPAEKVTF